MKHLIAMSMIFILVGCAGNDLNTVNEEECGIKEMLNGISCIEPDYTEIAKHPLGSRENPVRAEGPAGQRAYLARLICNTNEPVWNFYRAGSVGIGPYGFMLDLYNVECITDKGTDVISVFMDLYHKGYVENRVAKGFLSIQDAES